MFLYSTFFQRYYCNYVHFLYFVSHSRKLWNTKKNEENLLSVLSFLSGTFSNMLKVSRVHQSGTCFCQSEPSLFWTIFIFIALSEISHSFYCICLCRTLTTPVELIKCLKSIKENAFVASEYPVVITLEDHLTPELQAKVAEVCAWSL